MGERIDIIGVDTLRCDNVFGTSPCTATGEKCVNSWATCKDKVNFADVDHMVYFCTSTAELPAIGGEQILPFIDGSSGNPSINYSAPTINPEDSLGKNGSLTVNFIDPPHSDIGFDPYIADRTENPFYKSTFFRKFRARWPYLVGRKMEWWTGEMHEPFDIDNLTKRSFIIESSGGTGGDSGFQIVGKDPLKVIADDRIQFPPKSKGTLVAALDEADTPSTLDIYTTNKDEYDILALETVGVICIGSEIIQYTGINKTVVSDGVRLTGITRAAPIPYETKKQSHSAAAQVQKAPFFYQIKPHLIYNFLLGVVAGLSDYIDLPDWEDQDDLLGFFRVSRLIHTPQGVRSHINELIQQASTFGIWFDDKAQTIRYVVNRYENMLPTSSSLTDDTMSDRKISEDANALLNELIYNYEQRDPTKSQSEETNYRYGIVTIDSESQSARNYDQQRLKTINARWTFGANGIELANAAARQVAARAVIPVVLEAVAPPTIGNTIELSDVLYVKTSDLPDAFGRETQRQFQVIEKSVVKTGTRFKLKSFSAPVPINERYRPIQITADRKNVTGRQLFDEYYPDETPTDKDIFIYVNSGVVVGSTSVENYAISFLASEFSDSSGFTVTLVVNHFIVGMGGAGGYYGASIGVSPFNGGAGGDALFTDMPINIDNTNGVIGGGGGGGGSGAWIAGGGGVVVGGGGGGGGAGAVTGAGGTPYTPGLFAQGGAGTNGSLDTKGDGGDGGFHTEAGLWIRGGVGGDAGALGESGFSGTIGSSSGAVTHGTPGAGGAAGIAVTGNSFITWIEEGDIRGAKV